MIDPTTADNALADVLWWLKGFAAANPPEERGEVAAMAENLRQIRQWLGSLEIGDKRLLGQNEHTFACVVTENELEVIIEGLHVQAPGSDRERSLEKARAIYQQFFGERRALLNSRNPEVPF